MMPSLRIGFVVRPIRRIRNLAPMKASDEETAH